MLQIYLREGYFQNVAIIATLLQTLWAINEKKPH